MRIGSDGESQRFHTLQDWARTGTLYAAPLKRHSIAGRDIGFRIIPRIIPALRAYPVTDIRSSTRRLSSAGLAKKAVLRLIDIHLEKTNQRQERSNEVEEMLH